MKKVIFLLVSACSLTANAQTIKDSTSITSVTTHTSIVNGVITTTKSPQVTTNKVIKIDSTAIVRDSAGTKYAYQDWLKLVRTGEYRLKSKDGGPMSTAAEFVLVKRNVSAKELAMSKASLPNGDETGVIKTNAPFDFFDAEAMDGYKIDAKKLQGKVVVLNFWFINCAPCRQEMPELAKIASTYANNPNVVFIAIATDRKDALNAFLKNNPFPYHIVSGGLKFQDKYGITGYPTNVIIGKDGKVKYHSMGYGAAVPDIFGKTIAEALSR